MRTVFGLVSVPCLSLVVLVAGCRSAPPASGPVASVDAGKAALKTAAAHASSQTTPAPIQPHEELQRQYEVAVVVNNLMQALRKEDWTKAVAFFCADFRQAHQKELLDGNLLRYDPHIGKSSQSILHYPGACVRRVAIRGERAWAEIQAGCGPWGQVGITALELVREQGQWKLLRFPPSSEALDALRAGYDGESAGQWFKGMLSDGDFSQEEQAEIAEVLDAYYAMVVQLESEVEGRPLPRRKFVPATMHELKKVAESLKARPDLNIARITFWCEPRENVAPVSQALVEQAIQHIYEGLAAVRDEYPELAKFDEEHVKISDSGLSYAPNPPKWHQKNLATVMVSIRAPYLGGSQAAFPRRIFLPRQKLAVSGSPARTDKPLEKLVTQTIEKNIEPLIRFEKVLGGEAVRDNW